VHEHGVPKGGVILVNIVLCIE